MTGPTREEETIPVPRISTSTYRDFTSAAFDARNVTRGGRELNAGSLIRNRHDDQRVEGLDGGILPRNGPIPLEQDNEPDHDVVQQPAASTEPEIGKRRMKWTKNINTQVMRSYFIVTDLETNMTMYCNRLHEDFVRAMPNLSHLSAQRIADQRRTILKRNLLPAATIDQIRESVRNYLDTANSQPPEELTQTEHATEQQTEWSPRYTDYGNNSRDEQQPVKESNEQSPSNLEIRWKNSFDEYRVKYAGTDPSLRPKIPKMRYSPAFHKILAIANACLEQTISQSTDLEELHLFIYCTAMASVTSNDQKQPIPRSTTVSKKAKPPWEIRIAQNIENLRKDIGRLQQMANGTTSRKITSKLPSELTKQLNGKPKQETRAIIIDYLDTLKQKLAAFSKRLRRYQEGYQRKVQNNQFVKNERYFYRSLENREDVGEPPELADVVWFAIQGYAYKNRSYVEIQ